MTVYKTSETPLPTGSKFVRWSGRTYAVHNWQHRTDSHDAVIVRPLDDPQSNNYREGKKQGHTDTSLYFHIFPEPKKAPSPSPSSRKVSIDVSLLYKDQLITLIEKRTKTKIKGLAKLDREDLESLLMGIQDKRR